MTRCSTCGWSRGHDYGCPNDPLNPGATPPRAGSETTASASVQGVAEYHAWCGDISEEVTLRRAVSVMEDVLGDISDWEDKALSEAVEASRRDLQAMVDAIALRGQGVMGAEVDMTDSELTALLLKVYSHVATPHLKMARAAIAADRTRRLVHAEPWLKSAEVSERVEGGA